jgi:endonuclease III
VLTPREIVRLLRQEYGELAWCPRGDAMNELVQTVLSQNTSDSNSSRAFARLLVRFSTWEDLLAADPAAIEEAIQVGGLARVKAPRIKAIVEEVWSRQGSLRQAQGRPFGSAQDRSFDLSFLREMPLVDARAWLRSLPGVGPKTAACVLLFALGRPALPVDTHVHRLAKRLGLVPSRVTAEKAHEILEGMLAPGDAPEAHPPPAEVYAFHMGLVKHGRRICKAQRPLCRQCVLAFGCPSAVISP